MDAYLLDWVNLLLRWAHIITAIAWIGSSFYFVFLDNSLTQPTDAVLKDKGVDGELWAVHGGGFYHPQKYLVAPRQMPEHLHWFYWESYSTWLTGFARSPPTGRSLRTRERTREAARAGSGAPRRRDPAAVPGAS